MHRQPPQRCIQVPAGTGICPKLPRYSLEFITTALKLFGKVTPGDNPRERPPFCHLRRKSPEYGIFDHPFDNYKSAEAFTKQVLF